MELLKELLKRLGFIEFAALWTAFGIFGLVKIQGWEATHEADFREIESGNAEMIALTVTDKVRRRMGDDVDYGIHLGNEADRRLKYSRLPKRRWDAVAIGDEHTGYLVNGRVRVYEFDRGNFHLGRWAAIGVMIVPGVVGLLLTFYFAVRACNNEQADGR